MLWLVLNTQAIWGINIISYIFVSIQEFQMNFSGTKLDIPKYYGHNKIGLL